MDAKERYTIYLAVGIILFSLTSFTVSLCTYLKHRKVFTEWETDSKRCVCVACKLLTQTSPDSEELSLINSLSRQSKNGVDKCCAENQQQLSALLELVHHKQSRNNELVTYDPGNVTFSHVSAHKLLLPYNSEPGRNLPPFNESNVPLKLDNSTHTLRQHAMGVEALASGYHILVDGVYHIYSSIEFISRTCQENDLQPWRHSIVRRRPNQRQNSGVILSSLHTCCDDCYGDRETSYTGGVFYLQAGDHLHVEVSGTELASFLSTSNYFGLVLMGDVNQ